MENCLLISAVLPSHQSLTALKRTGYFFYSYQRTVDDERHYLFVFQILFVILGRSISIHIYCPNFLTNKRVGGKDNVVICQPVKIYCSDIHVRVIQVGNWVFEIKQVYVHVYVHLTDFCTLVHVHVSVYSCECFLNIHCLLSNFISIQVWCA